MVAYFTVAIIFALAGIALGRILKGREIKKEAPTMLLYSGLTMTSKKLAKGYIESRALRDEKSTFTERRK